MGDFFIGDTLGKMLKGESNQLIAWCIYGMFFKLTRYQTTL
jgi:hypothetical protein